MLIDSHCHLDAAEFDPDRAAVITRARSAGVARQVLPAVAAEHWPKLRDICAADAGLFPAYGLHPMFLASHRPGQLDDLRDWIERERPVAIGECGLDFFVKGLDHADQQRYFEVQLQIARESGLPLILHARRAVEAVIVAIRRANPASASGQSLRGVVHSYAGSAEQARQLRDLGFLVGIGGPVTYPRAKRLRRLVAELPIEQLLLETDAPDQPDSDIRGQRNEPARLTTVLQVVAQLRDEDPAAIAEATTANAERLFDLPPRSRVGAATAASFPGRSRSKGSPL